MVSVISDLSDYVLSSDLSELTFTTNAGSAEVIFSIGENEILHETYVPDSTGIIRIRNLSELLDSYLYVSLVETFHYSINDRLSAKVEKDFTVQYCAAEIDMDAGSFLDSYFLTLLVGDKVTSITRQEYLHLVCRTATSVSASILYSVNGRTETKIKELARISDLNKVVSVEVSPALMQDEGKELLSYTIVAGGRLQKFLIDKLNPPFNPVLLFTNSFGCQETFYCLGTFQLEPEFERNIAYIDGKYRAYKIAENRKYKANTGILTTGMANWVEDLFRSKEVYLLHGNIPGKEVTITESKIVRSNAPDELPSINFEYRYAQRNHNIFSLTRAGRIFDSTFDRTFN